MLPRRSTLHRSPSPRVEVEADDRADVSVVIDYEDPGAMVGSYVGPVAS